MNLYFVLVDYVNASIPRKLQVKSSIYYNIYIYIRDAPEPGNLPESVPWLRRRSWHKTSQVTTSIHNTREARRLSDRAIKFWKKKVSVKMMFKNEQNVQKKTQKKYDPPHCLFFRN